MKKEEPITDVGVIIARFQVDELHKAHIDLIEYVSSRHSKVIIFLGVSPIKCTYNNPLDFESRKQMVQEKFPDVIILYIKDMKSDKEWSKTLDSMILDIISPNQTVSLYGGRSSFIRFYSGKYICEELRKANYLGGYHYDHIISVVDWLKNKGVKMKLNKRGSWYCNSKIWWKSKSEICREYNIELLLDDKLEYKKYIKNNNPLFLHIK